MNNSLRKKLHRIYASAFQLRMLLETNKEFRAFVNVIKSQKYSLEEAELLSQIQDLANSIKKSQQEVELVDFGAGKNPSLELDESEMNKGKVSTVSVSDLPMSHGFLAEVIFRLLRKYRPQSCLELGTSVGVSATYMIGALKLNGSGKLFTLEGAPDVAKFAEAQIGTLGYPEVEVLVGNFQETLPKLLQDCSVDFAFIDGHHTEKATVEYFYWILESVEKEAILVFDDINWSDGMRSAWQRILDHQNVKFAVDLFHRGIVFVDKEKQTSTKHYTKLYISD